MENKVYFMLNGRTMKPIRVQPILQSEPKLLQYPAEFPKNTCEPTKSKQNIYHSLKFFFVASKLLSVLPQENEFSNPEDMTFNWKSWKTALTLFFLALHTLAAILCIVELVTTHFSMSTIELFVYYGGASATLILYLSLAKRNWAKFIIKWCDVDKIMNKTYGYPELLNRRLRTVFIAFGILSSIDFLLGAASRYFRELNIYKSNYTTEHFYLDHYKSFFKHVPYVNVLSGIYCSMVTLHASFLWGFNDLFIILLSIAMALRFRQIYVRISGDKTKEKSKEYWMEIREDFDRLSLLCQDLDSNISFIILLSYAQNIFFLLVQLFHSLESINCITGKTYFAYSFVYLIIKVTSVSLYAAWINDESKNIGNILNSVPSVSYNVEIHRLLTQINFDNVALTGCKMYKITRGLILDIASAVVTYELVLIQFSQASDGF